MGITALPGSLIMFGEATSGDNDTTAAPSMFYQGAMLLDTRSPFTYQPGQGDSASTYGWYGIGGRIPIIDQVPTTISTNSVAQVQTPVSGTALTLTATNSNNVTISQTVTNAITGVATTVRAIDGAMTTTTFGSNASLAAWSPATSLSRQLTITSLSTNSDSGATFTIAGFDIYGYPMSETLTGSSIGSGATLTTQKTWKYISSITPSGTLGSSNLIVGVNDVFGLPLRADDGAYLSVYFAGATTLSSTQATAASTAATATSTTGDVRGTWGSSTASNNSRRLVMFWSPKVANMASNDGIFGVTQYST